MIDQKERATQIQQSIRQVLVRDWNPIGLNRLKDTDDEYDAYIGPVYRMLASGTDAGQLIERLIYFERVSMGLPAIPDRKEELQPVAAKLLRLDVSI